MDQPWLDRSGVRWAAWGAGFGAVFPLVALALRWAALGRDGAIDAFAHDPLMWIITTAPLFLGGFAAMGGVEHDRVRALGRELEQRVLRRTADLHAALAHQRLILDSAGDALVVVGHDGRVRGEASTVAVQWFGAPSLGHAGPWLFGHGSVAALSFEIGLAAIVEGALPEALLLGQLPARHHRGDRRFDVIYRRFDEDALLLVIRDTTDAAVAERAAVEQAERGVVLAKILADGGGFRRFRHEAQALVESVLAPATPDRERCRALHTLKGSAAVMGLVSLSAACHALETALDEGGWTAACADGLRDAWASTQRTVDPFAPLFDTRRLEATTDDVDALVRAVGAGMSRADITTTPRSWALHPAGPALAHLADHARRTADRLGRAVEVEVDAGGLRVDCEQTREFWNALAHVVRNAVDHGLESHEERVRARKVPRGRLWLLAQAHLGRSVLRIRDDGRGIDWAAVRRAAVARGLPVATHDDLVAALFADGLTTRAAVTDLSGRGVGLAAVKAACDRLGILIQLQSEPGLGTEWTFVFPPASMSDNPAPNAPSQDTPVP